MWTRAAALLAVAALVFALPIAWQAAGEQITPHDTTPLENIDISPDLSCTVNYTGDSSDEWFTDGDVDACGTFVALSYTNSDRRTVTEIFGPGDVPGGYEPFNPDAANSLDGDDNYTAYSYRDYPSNQVTSGSGTAVDPYRIVTTVELGETGVELVEADTYVDGQNSYRTDVELTNLNESGPTYHAVLFRAGDCYLQDDDSGLGTVVDGDAPICTADPDGPDTQRTEGMYPLTSGSSYFEGYYDCLWQAIAGETGLGTGFPDELDIGANNDAPGEDCASEPPDGAYDNALGLSWGSFTLSPDTTSTTYSALNVFSPDGASALTFSKSADTATVGPGASDGYTITISNPGAVTESLQTIEDDLPPGFAYTAGSTTGLTTADPATTATDGGEVLTWTGQFTIPAGGSKTLHFAVTAAGTQGTYYNSATGTSAAVGVVPAVQVAPVSVVAAPIASDDSYSTDYETALSEPAPGLLSNDTAPSDQSVTVDTTSVTTPAHGSVTVNADGSFTYTPDSGYSGTDTFTYRDISSDGADSTTAATVSIVVKAPPAPTATDDKYGTPYATALSVSAPGVLSNDSGPKDRTLTVEPSSVTNPAHGSVTVKADGSFTYTPDSGFSGTDTFTYRDVSDGVESNTATVRITVAPPQAPTAVNDTYATSYQQQLSVIREGGVLVNDTAPAGQGLAVDTASVTNPAHGSVTVNADGSFTYTPDSGFSGTDTFTYRDVSDGVESNTATVTIHVGSNNYPVANDDYYSTPYQTVLIEGSGTGLLANDQAPQDESIEVDTGSVIGPSHGTVDVHADGSFTYTPDSGFSGTDTFTYRDDSGDFQSDPATVHITVAAPLAPTAVGDSYTTAYGTTLTKGAAAGLLANDLAPAGQSIAVDTASVTNPAHGSVSVHANGSFTYTPDSGFSGTDTFTYRDVSDGAESNAATVRIDVRPSAAPSSSSTPSPTPSPSTTTSSTPSSPSTSASTSPTTSPTSSTVIVVPAPSSTTPPPAPSSTPTPPPPPSPSPSPSARQSRSLRLSAPSVLPGGQLTATGHGCPANSTVSLTVAGRPAGTGTADANGTFSIPASTPALTPGNYQVIAICGDRQLATTVALVDVVGASATPTAQGLTVAAVLAFFLLLLGLTIRRPGSR